MAGIKEGHWQCLRCHCMIGPKRRVEVVPMGRESGEWYHIAEGEDPQIYRAQMRARMAGDEGGFEPGLRLHVCGPVEPVLAKQRLIEHLRVDHDGLPHDDEQEPEPLEQMTMSRLLHFHGWAHEHDELELPPDEFDPDHVRSYYAKVER